MNEIISDTDTDMVNRWIAEGKAMTGTKKLFSELMREQPHGGIKEPTLEDQGYRKLDSTTAPSLQSYRDREINRVLTNAAMSAAELAAKALINQIQTGRTGWIHELWDAAQSRPSTPRRSWWAPTPTRTPMSMMDAPPPPRTREQIEQLARDKASVWNRYQWKDMR